MINLKSFSFLCILGIAFSAGVGVPPKPPTTGTKAGTTTTTTQFPTTTTTPKVQVTQPTTTTFEVPAVTSTTTFTPAETTTAFVEIPSSTDTTTAVTEAAPEVATTTDANQIRVCKCDEVKICDEKAYKKVDQCKTSCKSHLDYFGTETDKYYTCFTDAVTETEKITKCMKSNVDQFCADKTANATFIEKPDYTKYFESYGINEDTLEATPEMQKKAREVFIQQRKFQTCVIECIKKESVQCYEETGCAIGFPAKNETTQILDSCPLFKTELHMNAMKSCQCLAFKQGVKKLIGKCAYVVSPYLMRKL